MIFNIKRDREYLTTSPTFEQGVTNIQTLLNLCPKGKDATFSIEDDARQLVASVTNRRIMGEFTKQVWTGPKEDTAMHVAEELFDATQHILLMPYAAFVKLEDSDDTTDAVGRAHVAWEGPCYVTVVDSICAYFGVERIDHVSEEAFAFARKCAQVHPPREEVVTVTFDMRLRVAPGADIEQFVKEMACAVASRTNGVKVAYAGQPVILKAA